MNWEDVDTDAVRRMTADFDAEGSESAIFRAYSNFAISE